MIYFFGVFSELFRDRVPRQRGACLVFYWSFALAKTQLLSNFSLGKARDRFRLFLKNRFEVLHHWGSLIGGSLFAARNFVFYQRHLCNLQNLLSVWCRVVKNRRFLNLIFLAQKFVNKRDQFLSVFRVWHSLEFREVGLYCFVLFEVVQLCLLGLQLAPKTRQVCLVVGDLLAQ